MKILVYSGAEMVGWAKLTKTDPPMGYACGIFHANEGYKKIQPLVREQHSYDGTLGQIDDEKLGPIRDKLKSFELIIKTETGMTLCPAAGISFVDFTNELENEPIQLEVLGLESRVFNLLFPDEYQKYEEQFHQT